MAKSLVLGNGSLTVGMDSFGQVKDCYFDYVGLENQIGEQGVNRVGVWVDGLFSWLGDGSWNISIDYKKETLIGDIVARNEHLQIELHITDCVYNESNIFIRNIHVKNLHSEKRIVRVFLNHQFRMYRIKKGDTVYYDPQDQTIVHYKGRRIAVIGGFCGDHGFTDYTVGLAGIEGKEGTFKDAEDGVLSKNAVEHGTVDSTVAYEHLVEPHAMFDIYTWICFAKEHSDAKKLHQYVLKRAPAHLIETTEHYWNAWVNKMNFNFYGLTEDIISVFKKSLLILRVHVGNMGEVIASVDSDMLQWGRDNYNYVWPRDGAYVATALDRANYSEASRHFFEFCNEVISEEGYFFHKYRPDKSLGSSWHPWVGPHGEHQLPIQEDETAQVIIALWYHYEKTHDIEFIERIYNSLIKKTANFMLGFVSETKLPYPTYDLWEMKWGTHTYTVATVYGALQCAAKFADLLGKEYEANQYKTGAEEIQAVASNLLWNEKTQYFHKSVDLVHNEIVHDELIDASSFYGVFSQGLFEETDARLNQAFETLEKHLTARGHVGGIVRFENDEYFREDEKSNGNPWIITTLWRAQYLLTQAENEESLLKVAEIFRWVTTYAQQSGILAEQLNPGSGSQLSAAPLAWSHAEFVNTILLYLEKAEKLGLGEVYPKDINLATHPVHMNENSTP